jgi:ribonucleoside-diphosphate reductase alpha chain
MSATVLQQDEEMQVIKRDGNIEYVMFDKILTRIKKIGDETGIKLNFTSLVVKVIDQLYTKITTTKIDELLAEQCASLSSTHPDYNILAGHIIISNHQKNTIDSFSQTMTQLYEYKDKQGKHCPIVSEELFRNVRENAELLDTTCDYKRDYLIDYFGFKTLERSYFMKINKKSVERIQHLWMRVSLGIHGNNIERAIQTYHLMSQKYFTHATPTLFNAGTNRSQLASCFLQSMESDSLEGIFSTLTDCAKISKWSGGIGLHIHNIRASGSQIRGTNGISTGIVPMLRVFNNVAKYINQGSKRNGSFAIYLEPWHSDIEAFLQMRKNHGDEELKARDLFYALWIPDLFMVRVKTAGTWTLMCPDECPGLSDVYGDDFEKLYCHYETEGKGRKTIPARDLWMQILDAQMETGTPYMLYKDACNKKSNQKNIGTIKSSNLCVAPETKILTDKGHIEIQTLKGQKVNVWNGQEYSEVEVFQTGIDQELIEVHTSDGCVLHCTKYHKFYVNDGRKKIKTVDAENLIIGDKLQKCEFPIIDGKETMMYPYTHGFFCGDGTYGNTGTEEKQCCFNSLDNHYYCKRHLDFETKEQFNKLNNEPTTNKIKCNANSYMKKPIIFLYGEKEKLLEYIDYRGEPKHSSNRINVMLPLDISEKFYVPFNCTLKDKLTWFSGYCDADGTIANNGTNQQLQVASINKEFLLDVKLMLQTCGINAKIRISKEKGNSYLPDGKGGHKYFNTEAVYRLLIPSFDLQKLHELGFSPKRLKINKIQLQRSACQFVKIEKIVNNGRIDNTFCFTEPKRNTGIFNGVFSKNCTEIIQYSDDKETAVCNLASIALPTFVNKEEKTIDYERLKEITGIVTYNLNRVIDVNYYPTDKTRTSNFRHRPIGLGVQGLADVFMMLDIAFDSPEAAVINRNIFETIYFGALTESCQLAIRDGKYETFDGSPASQGILQFDMWNVNPGNARHDWDSLKVLIQTHGLRNSLLVAPMPTASTSQILGYNECIEPITSNIYSRGTLSGDFVLANKYLMKDLIHLGLWNEKMKNNIIANHGSIQHLDNIPLDIRNKYKTVWEIPMKTVINMAVDRAAFICQSQSLNLWVEDPNYNGLTSMHFYAWSKGLKTGIYYLRRRGKHEAQQFTIEPEKNTDNKIEYQEDDGPCESCSA